MIGGRGRVPDVRQFSVDPRDVERLRRAVQRIPVLRLEIESLDIAIDPRANPRGERARKKRHHLGFGAQGRVGEHECGVLRHGALFERMHASKRPATEQHGDDGKPITNAARKNLNRAAASRVATLPEPATSGELTPNNRRLCRAFLATARRTSRQRKRAQPPRLYRRPPCPLPDADPQLADCLLDVDQRVACKDRERCCLVFSPDAPWTWRVAPRDVSVLENAAQEAPRVASGAP